MVPSLHDSLFIYTNFNAPRSFVLCKDFRIVSTNEYKCTNAKDLFEEYGRSMPPLLDGRTATATIKILNIHDLARLVSEQGYVYLIASVSVLKKAANIHQLFVKFDWYLWRERVGDLELPSFKTNLQGVDVDVSDSESGVFRRYYLRSFKDVLQAYRVDKVESACDGYLREESLKKEISEHKPLSLSTVRHFFKCINFYNFSVNRTPYDF